MVLLLSGDGDWAAFVREMAALLAAHGAPVLGLKMRSYLSEPRTPEESAVLLEEAVRAQLASWNRTELIVIGYSRGADFAPFVFNRWSAELRAQVTAIVFIGLSEYASFEFHLQDLLRDVVRPEDVPTRPELARLSAIPLLCVRGEEELESFCRQPVPGMRVLTHEGAHRAQSGDGTAELVLHELGLDK
jgi:type IV secretory pathway VirJ component